MNQLNTVSLSRQNEARRNPARHRPTVALLMSVIFHSLLIGICILIPYTIKSHTPAATPPQFTLHYSSDEDMLAGIPDPQVEDQVILAPRSLTHIVQLIPKIIAARLSPSLPIITLSATFIQSERVDSFAEDLPPSLEFPDTKTEPAKESKKKSSQTPNGSKGLIAARPLKRRAPLYPSLARNKGYEGTSVFIATINSDGTIENLKLSKTSGHAILDQAAKEALRHWKFTPATRNGSTVASQLRIPIIFRLG